MHFEPFWLGNAEKNDSNEKKRNINIKKEKPLTKRKKKEQMEMLKPN